jgi:hypothetical protein
LEKSGIAFQQRIKKTTTTNRSTDTVKPSNKNASLGEYIGSMPNRNPRRFPEDFMFQLTWEELKNLKSQFVTSSWGGTRKRPFAFTEHGIAMLSSVLRSEKNERGLDSERMSKLYFR